MIKKAESFVRQVFAGDASGHDAEHTFRVYRLALTLAREEGADPEITALAALLHDVDDRKLSPDTAQGLLRARGFLEAQGMEEYKIQQILTVISQISFRGTDSVVPTTAEGKCVQDADRLDAMGAIGIARTFAYGGSRERPIYTPGEAPRLDMDGKTYESRTDGCSLNHFYEKLLLLKDRMNTESGKRLARHRHQVLEEFLEEFLKEWEGEV